MPRYAQRRQQHQLQLKRRPTTNTDADGDRDVNGNSNSYSNSNRYANAAPTPTPTPVTAGGVAGQVTYADTGEAIEGAELSSAGQILATTNSQGAYAIQDVPAGTYPLTATADDYIATHAECYGNRW